MVLFVLIICSKQTQLLKKPIFNVHDGAMQNKSHLFLEPLNCLRSYCLAGVQKVKTWVWVVSFFNPTSSKYVNSESVAKSESMQPGQWNKNQYGFNV